MKKLSTILFILLLVAFFSCKKKEIISPAPPHIPKQWEKYVGNYKVYDTLGNYIYDMNISHYIGISTSSGNPLDSILIQNFADTFDLRFQFSFHTPEAIDFIDIGFNDSVVDYNNKMWWVARLFDDSTTTIKENYLINDTIVFYFEQNNIKFYINEIQPYYRCECRHIAVKQ